MDHHRSPRAAIVGDILAGARGGSGRHRHRDALRACGHGLSRCELWAAYRARADGHRLKTSRDATSGIRDGVARPCDLVPRSAAQLARKTARHCRTDREGGGSPSTGAEGPQRGNHGRTEYAHLTAAISHCRGGAHLPTSPCGTPEVNLVYAWTSREVARVHSAKAQARRGGRDPRLTDGIGGRDLSALGSRTREGQA